MPSTSLATLFTGTLVLITSAASDKRFCPKELVENTAIGSEGYVYNAAIPTTNGTIFLGLSISEGT
jgi:hypothetical protein